MTVMTGETGENDDDEREYRVVRRRRETDDPWRTVITQRGLGRPFRSLPAAKGLMTRELRYGWNNPYEYKIQWRPVSSKWLDVES